MANTGFGSHRCDTKRFVENFRALSQKGDPTLLGTAHSVLHDLRDLIAPGSSWQLANDDIKAIKPMADGTGWIIQDMASLKPRYTITDQGTLTTHGARVTMTVRVARRDGVALLLTQCAPKEGTPYIDLTGVEQNGNLASLCEFPLHSDPLNAPTHPGYGQPSLTLRHVLGRFDS